MNARTNEFTRPLASDFGVAFDLHCPIRAIEGGYSSCLEDPTRFPSAGISRLFTSHEKCLIANSLLLKVDSH